MNTIALVVVDEAAIEWLVRGGPAAAAPVLQLRSSALGGYLIHLESMLSGMLHARAPSVPQHVVAAQRCGLSGGSGDY